MKTPVLNLDRLLKKLADREKKGRREAGVVLAGYETPYAVEVHNDLETPRADGQALFLQTPARARGRELGEAAAAAVARGGTLDDGLVAAGELLGTYSKPLVPVLTGRLRDSYFVRKV